MRCYHVFIQIKRVRTWALKKNNHFLEAIGDIRVVIVTFIVLKKCSGKLDSVIYEILFIKERKPS